MAHRNWQKLLATAKAIPDNAKRKDYPSLAFDLHTFLRIATPEDLEQVRDANDRRRAIQQLRKAKLERKRQDVLQILDAGGRDVLFHLRDKMGYADAWASALVRGWARASEEQKRKARDGRLPLMHLVAAARGKMRLDDLNERAIISLETAVEALERIDCSNGTITKLRKLRTRIHRLITKGGNS